MTKPNFTVSPFVDIKKRKCSRNCIHVVMWRILILSWYIKQSMSVSVLLCYMINHSTEIWEWAWYMILQLAILKYTFPCYSEDLRVILWYLNLALFQVEDLMATITEFARENYWATIVIISYDNDSLIFDMHIMIKMISRYYHSNYHPNFNKLSKYQFSNK